MMPLVKMPKIQADDSLNGAPLPNLSVIMIAQRQEPPWPGSLPMTTIATQNCPGGFGPDG